jgi:4-amino-4-deoxy-L-arabinose transferase-like glycosyltransferase
VGERIRRYFPWRGLAVFGLVALPWFLAVTARVPAFPHYVFVRETFERVTTPSFHRTAPFWYYLPILPAAAFPWIVPVLARLGGGRAKWAWHARRVNLAARDPILLACWVLGPLAFFMLNQSKLPQYVLPLMPAFALAAARALTLNGVAGGWKAHAGFAVALAVALFTIPLWLPRALPLTAAELAAIPPTARAVAVTLLASVALVALAVRRGDLTLAAGGYAVVVLALPLVGADLLRAVGDDRSAASLANAVRGRAVLAVSAYPPSLPFYLQRQVPVATAHGRELTSNFIADYVDEYRAVPGSPLLPADAWRSVLAECREPTVFVTRPVDRHVRDTLAFLPMLFQGGRYVAYGPCIPRRVPPLRNGEGQGVR